MQSQAPIREKAQLLEYIGAGAKPPAEWGIGLEFEQLGLTDGDFRPLPWTGRRSISAVFDRLRSDWGWSGIREAGTVIALERNGTRVTLEPGGQLELSGRIQRYMPDLREELVDFHRQLRAVSDPLGIHWLSIGLHPFAGLDDIAWIPKQRYRILSAHLARRGRLAHNMMKQTAGAQVNIDFENEADAMEKFRVAMGLTSIVTALFANSPISDGRPNGFMSRRAHIWMHTDPDRCGLLRFAFEPGLSFERYVDYALEVPSLFVIRDGSWLGTGGVPFRRLMREGWNGEPVRVEDWGLHLTGLFPEVRLKQYMEIRSADATTIPRAVAFAALWMGLLYDPPTRRDAWALVDALSWEDRVRLHAAVCRDGLRARLGAGTVRDLAERLIDLAEAGLERFAGRSDSATGRPLDALRPLVRGEGSSPARDLLTLWEEENWADRPEKLVAHCTR
jgi:glutamate--cysteine ligase